MNNKLIRWFLVGAFSLFALGIIGGMIAPFFFGGTSGSWMGYGYGCAGNWGYHSPMMMGWRSPFSAFGMLLVPLAILLLLIGGIVWIIQYNAKPQNDQ